MEDENDQAGPGEARACLATGLRLACLSASCAWQDASLPA